MTEKWKLAQATLAGVFPAESWKKPKAFTFDSNEKVSIAKCSPVFHRLGADPTFGNKHIVASGSEAVYAEIAVLNLLRKDGFDGVWTDGFRNKFWKSQTEECSLSDLPRHARDCYERIAEANDGNLDGRWDLLAWKNETLIFVECKRKDSMTPSEVRWLRAALNAGFGPELFVICKWRPQ
jgi:hypothetical protein